MKAILPFTVLICCTVCFAAPPPEPGLLFYLSGDKQTTADYAASGAVEPNYLRGIQVKPGGAKGTYFECADTQQMSYWAPGNIFAQRGTLSFFWRSRYAVGPTEFPVFRVAFADHSSWDMVWLRIDYNGHGFDAFVTDASLSRVRVSVKLDSFPKPDQWTHLAISWDETRGIRFYVNGKLAASDETVAVLNTGLDQFGPHSRIISPHQVQSDYNFVRGGDMDELRIYDRMLGDDNIASLAKGDAAGALPPLAARDLSNSRWHDEWNTRYGWNRPNDAPPYLDKAATSVRKVEIHDAYDIKRWWWKANDGIRETTWPGVYNRSRLPGRHDYFTLPDWDCYVDSGKAITFTMPDEPWNHLEISGAAWGKMFLAAGTEKVLFERPKGQEKTFNRLPEAIRGQKIRFENVEQEQPIGELSAYNVTAGAEPAGTQKLAFRLSTSAPQDAAKSMIEFIDGRFAPDERAITIAQPANIPPASRAAPAGGSLPLVHILIPDTWDPIQDGLDGIAIDLPAMTLKGQTAAFNIQVHDPLWLYRDMLDFSFSIKPGEARTLWLDLRDRILPEGKGFLIDIASNAPDFNAAMLEGAQVRLVFKSRDAAKPEHEIDRFTQVKDVYAQMTEEHPANERLNMWNRYFRDVSDLMKVNPTHNPGQSYAAVNSIAPRPTVALPTTPPGVPVWAFRQVELLKRAKAFVNYYIDQRQSDFGDFGGGISDDVDLLNTWPGVALMGSDPDKVRLSLHRLIEAAYKNGMFTNGLPTIQCDELHSYEEGINCLAQNLILDYGNPQQLERAMETARGVESVTGINPAGHRHFMTSYYSGTKMATEAPWNWAKPYSHLVMQVPQLLVDFNGNPHTKQIMVELADGLLAHRKADGNGRFSMPGAIQFQTDAEGESSRGNFPWHVFWAAWKFTGDKKYLDPLMDGGIEQVNANVLDILNLRQAGRGAAAGGARGGRGGGGRGGGFSAWQSSGNKTVLESAYASQIEQADYMNYINTEGSLWIDRVNFNTTDLQRARLGGVALNRNSLFPGHNISWRFQAPANDQSVAILIPDGTPTGFKVIAYNLESSPVIATMTGWYVDPGTWDISQGIDSDNDDAADQQIVTRSTTFERSGSLEFTLPPHATTVLMLKLKTPGTPYWQRPDLGIAKPDVIAQGNSIEVTVHSLGSVDAPVSTIALLDKSGKSIATANIPAIKAPLDLTPKTTKVTLSIPAGTQLNGCTIAIDPESKLEQITRMNDRVGL